MSLPATMYIMTVFFVETQTTVQRYMPRARDSKAGVRIYAWKTPLCGQMWPIRFLSVFMEMQMIRIRLRILFIEISIFWITKKYSWITKVVWRSMQAIIIPFEMYFLRIYALKIFGRDNLLMCVSFLTKNIVLLRGN